MGVLCRSIIEIDFALIDTQQFSAMLDVRSIRGVNIISECYMEQVSIRARISIKKNRKGENGELRKFGC